MSDSDYDEDDEKAKQKVIGLNEVQDMWQVAVSSPLGYTWPQESVSMWRIVEVAEKF